ncbi:hypothetical protein [Hamadaea tsunoensis]|uniref:hypothetical protein n=1 Tax=Hamadaea tsunoensis TaxID=53368 RepID=UPI000485584C|nr:hypothetical protein [Hamadaea tsunoensis]
MRGLGISYDTGFVVHGANSRPQFDPAAVDRDLRAIRDDLHCTAVRVMGGDPDRIAYAAARAADLGLAVWFSPYPLEATEDEMLALFADCAERAEKLRAGGAEVVFVAGAEHSLMNPGFLPGGTTEERLAGLFAGPAAVRELIPRVAVRINDFLGRALTVVRERFAGPVTYAAIQFERVDWTPFDILSMDLYRNSGVADQFAAGVRTLVAQGKPVAVTEFGSATFRGAGDLGARGLEVVEHDPVTRAPVRLSGVYERDEPGQAAYVRELLEIFDAAGVDSAFVFTFALSSYPHRPDGDPRDDLDLASYSIVRLREDGAWEPKAAFHAVAAYYEGRQAGNG